MVERRRREEINAELAKLVVEQAEAMKNNIYIAATEKHIEERDARWKRMNELRKELETLKNE